MNAIGDAQIVALLTQGMDVFERNENMRKHETLAAIGTLTSVLDTIKRAKGAKLIDGPLTTIQTQSSRQPVGDQPALTRV